MPVQRRRPLNEIATKITASKRALDDQLNVFLPQPFLVGVEQALGDGFGRGGRGADEGDATADERKPDELAEEGATVADHGCTAKSAERRAMMAPSWQAA